MRRAIELATKGEGHTDPNPLVGAVIVKDGRIIGEGYHEVYGSLHAERNALKNCTEDPSEADMYVTLEPCCHFGKQPPCTLALIEAGIRHVYVGSSDPNPKVAGKGIAQLKRAGIEVTENFMKEECDALNPVFFHYISTKEPYIALKYAMTADGRIATDSGRSQWITGAKAREHVHKLRNRYKGILVGIGTVLADDPILNCRIDGGRNPIRIVLDTYLSIPLESRLVQSAGDIPLIVVCGKSVVSDESMSTMQQVHNLGIAVSVSDSDEQGSCETHDKFTKGIGEQDSNAYQTELIDEKDAAAIYKLEQMNSKVQASSKVQEISNNAAHYIEHDNKLEKLKALGVEVLAVNEEGGHVSIAEALKALGERGINSILVEGGAHINGAFIDASKVNCIHAYIGAKIFGGGALKSPIIGTGFESLDTALTLGIPKVEIFGEDVLLSYDVK